MGELPAHAGQLREAGGKYGVQYTGPLSRAMRAQEAAGFQRTIQSQLEIVKVTGNVEVFDNFDFDVIIPEVANIQGVPESWMASPQKIAAKRQARQQAAEQQQQIQALPAQAAMVKAQASVAKQGGQAAVAMTPGGRPSPVSGQ
jgi:hypothetical protein